MKKKFLTLLIAILMILPCTFTLVACGKNPEEEAPVDMSQNNPEYIQYRNVMNTVASAFGSDIGLGEDANAESQNNSTPMGFAVNASSSSSLIGLDYDNITSSFLTKLEEFVTKTPDHIYDDPLYGFEEAILSCFKLPVHMIDAITWSHNATSAYGKTIWVGFDDDTMDETYYRVDKNGNHYSSIVYSPTTTNYQTGNSDPIEGGYYLNYTEVNYISKDNFSFYLISVSEDNNFSQIIVGDNNYNLIAFSFYNNMEYVTLNYSNGDRAKSRRLTTDTELNQEMKQLYESAIVGLNENFLDSVASSYDYKLTVAEIDAVQERILKEAGYSSDNKYPGWGVSDDGKTITGYFGSGNYEHIDKLVIPSDFTQIDGNFTINALSVDELVIPSTITKVMLNRSEKANREGSWYNGDYWWEYVDATPEDFGIQIYSKSYRPVIKKITLESTNGQQNQIFTIDEDQCLKTKTGNTLLYICDAEVDEYDFRGVTLSYGMRNNSYNQIRENVVNIKKISMDVDIKVEHTGDPNSPEMWQYNFPIMQIFMSASDNKIYLDELNLYGFNEPDFVSQNPKGNNISWSPTVFLNYGGTSGILNGLTSYIEKLNIYGNYTRFTYSDTYKSFYSTGNTYSDVEESTLLNDGISRFKIYSVYDFINLKENMDDYLVKLGLLTPLWQDLGNGQGYTYFDEQIHKNITNQVEEFSSVYQKYIFETFKSEQGDSFRPKFVTEVEFKNSDAIIDDRTAEVITINKDLIMDNLKIGFKNLYLTLYERDYPFLKEVYIDPEIGLNIDFRIEGNYNSKIKVHLNSAIINFNVSNDTKNKIELYLPWTESTYSLNNIYKRFNNGTGLDGFDVVFPSSDDDTTYSLWIYDYLWDDNIRQNVIILAGYFSNAETINELTLPTDTNYISSNFAVYGNVKKLIIPANYNRVSTDYYTYSKIGETGSDVTMFSLLTYDPLSFAEYSTTTIDVQSGSPLFKMVDGNLHNYDGDLILYYTIGSNQTVLDLRSNGIMKFMKYIDKSKITEIISYYKIVDIDVHTEMTIDNPRAYVYNPIASCYQGIILEGFTNLQTLTFYYLKNTISEERIEQIMQNNFDCDESKIREMLSSFCITDEIVPVGDDNYNTPSYELNIRIYGDNIVKIKANLDYETYYSFTYENKNFETIQVHSNVTVSNIYLNDEEITIDDYSMFTDDSILADTSNVTELTISTGTPKNIVYTANTITTVIIDNELTEMDGILINKLINFSYETRRDLDIYLPASITKLTGGMETNWGVYSLITFHFDITKEDFVTDIIDGETQDFSNIELFREYSIVGQYFDFNTYESGFDQFLNNDYNGVYCYSDWVEQDIGYKFVYKQSL